MRFVCLRVPHNIARIYIVCLRVRVRNDGTTERVRVCRLVGDVWCFWRCACVIFSTNLCVSCALGMCVANSNNSSSSSFFIAEHRGLHNFTRNCHVPCALWFLCCCWKMCTVLAMGTLPCHVVGQEGFDLTNLTHRSKRPNALTEQRRRRRRRPNRNGLSAPPRSGAQVNYHTRSPGICTYTIYRGQRPRAAEESKTHARGCKMLRFKTWGAQILNTHTLCLST